MKITYELKLTLKTKEHVEEFEYALGGFLERHAKPVQIQESSWQKIDVELT